MNESQNEVTNALVEMGYKASQARNYAKNGAYITDRESFIANFIGCDCGNADEAVADWEECLKIGDIEETTTTGEFIVFCL